MRIIACVLSTFWQFSITEVSSCLLMQMPPFSWFYVHFHLPNLPLSVQSKRPQVYSHSHTGILITTCSFLLAALRSDLKLKNSISRSLRLFPSESLQSISMFMLLMKTIFYLWFLCCKPLFLLALPPPPPRNMCRLDLLLLLGSVCFSCITHPLRVIKVCLC